MNRAEISNGSARVSILPQLQGFDVWEDMAKPTLYACIYMFDAISLLSTFPIIGEEDVVLEFETPGISKSVTYRFKVFEVMNVQQTENRKALGYTLRCISAEHYLNGSVEIRQSFVGPLSELALVIMHNYLRSTKPTVLEPSKGVVNVVVPKWKPLEALDFCRKHSISPTYSSSSYVAFENQAGFTFASVEYLIAAQQKDSLRTYKFLAAPSVTKESGSYRSVIAHENITRSDALDIITSGTLFSETETFDISTKSSELRAFQIANEYQKFITPDLKSRFPNSAEFVKKYGSMSPQRFFIVKDSSRPAEYLESSIAARNAYRTLLNGNITRILVHGDSGLKAGDLITLELPEIVGTTGRPGRDPLLAGNYLILRLRHIIQAGDKPHHECSLDLAKVAFVK